MMESRPPLEIKRSDFMPFLEPVIVATDVKTKVEESIVTKGASQMVENGTYDSELPLSPLVLSSDLGVNLIAPIPALLPSPVLSNADTNTSKSKSKSKPKDSAPKISDPFQFGSRYLEDEDKVWEHNAWDHVETDDVYKGYIKEQIKKQKDKPVTEFDKKRFNSHPEKFWDLFYRNNKENFFKDRKWLGQEFPILKEATAGPTVVGEHEGGTKENRKKSTVRVLEVGAGAGNTLFPILEKNRNPDFHITGVDFSAVSVEVIKSQEIYKENTPKHVNASVWDLANPEGTLPDGIAVESIDIIILIFVFSALAPWQWRLAMRNIKKVLKPGGQVLFRDYGRGDLAQVRFRGGRWLGENFYVRGDGTRVYFFEEDELRRIFEKEDFTYEGEIPKGIKAEDGEEMDKEEGSETGSYGSLEITNIGVDRRLLVNRKRLLKMYRCWLQLTATKTVEKKAVGL